MVPWRRCELTCDYPFPTYCVYIQCVSHPRFYQANISHLPSLYFYSLPAVVPTRLLMSAYQTSDGTSLGSSAGYVYRMWVEHSLLRTRKSGRSYPGDGVS